MAGKWSGYAVSAEKGFAGLQELMAEEATARQVAELEAKVNWAANKRFEISKFKFKFPRARTYELIRAISPLYRSQILQIHIRWKALAEIN